MNLNPNRRQNYSTYILVVLLTVPSLKSGYQFRIDKLHVLPDRKLGSAHVLNTHTARSVIECSVLCRTTNNCTIMSYNHATNVCQLGVIFYTESSAGWVSYNVEYWTLVFRAPKGIGGDVYASFVNATGVTTDRSECADLTSTACQTNYRHPVLDNWTEADFTQVRLSFYKSQAEVAFIVFNATGSNLTSWFARDRILNSTWPTSATDSYYTFSLDGGAFPNRRFIMHSASGGCERDGIYVVAIVRDGVCKYDGRPAYPEFLYASTESYGTPENGAGIDSADFMAIFVKS